MNKEHEVYKLDEDEELSEEEFNEFINEEFGEESNHEPREDNSKKKMSKKKKIGILLFVILAIWAIFYNANDGDSNCKYPGCNNPVYSYKNNINGYCEKHKREYENYEWSQDAKKYIDSNQ